MKFHESEKVDPYSASDRSIAFCQSTILSLLLDVDFCDVQFVCTDNRKISAHKIVLARQSRYFQTSLFKKGDTVQENCKVNKHYQFPAKACVLEAVKEYLYTGSIKELERAESFNGPGGAARWTALVTVAASYSMGGLDRYLSNLLSSFPVTSFAEATRRFEFAGEQKMPAVQGAMATAMSLLPFGLDDFSELSEESLTSVLNDVYIPVPETVVCQAVDIWVQEVLRAFDQTKEVPDCIVDSLSLEYISYDDLCSTIEPMNLFSMSVLGQAYKMHALSLGVKTRPNKMRGSNKDWNRDTSFKANDPQVKFDRNLQNLKAPFDAINEEEYGCSEMFESSAASVWTLSNSRLG